jgi:hypothetical protein
MTTQRFHSSAADSWTQPRAHRDPGLRRMHYGRIQPMEQDRSFWGRLLRSTARN